MGKLKYSDLKEDERCIYQAVVALEGGDPEAYCRKAIKGGAKEVDDEAAMVVLAKDLGYIGPRFISGSEFNKMKFDDGKKILAICTGSNLKKKVIESDSEAMAKLLMDPVNTSGVVFHAIGIVKKGDARVIHDKQEIRKNGPYSGDDVIYWVK